MTRIETEFLMTLPGTRLRLALEQSICEMASARLRIAPNKCKQIGASIFQWVETSPDHSPIDRRAYIQDVLGRRRRYLETEYWGALYQMMSCRIDIDGVSFYYRLDDGVWVEVEPTNQSFDTVTKTV